MTIADNTSGEPRPTIELPILTSKFKGQGPGLVNVLWVTCEALNPFTHTETHRPGPLSAHTAQKPFSLHSTSLLGSTKSSKSGSKESAMDLGTERSASSGISRKTPGTDG